jgi:hypothetical protein
MALSEVYGLDRFREYMEGFEDCYTVIGGVTVLDEAHLIRLRLKPTLICRHARHAANTLTPVTLRNIRKTYSG